MKPTPAQRGAVKWLRAHGGTGVINSGGYLLAGGEWGRWEPITWLRLSAMGLVKADVDENNALRLTLTDAGRELAGEGPAGATVHPKHAGP